MREKLTKRIVGLFLVIAISMGLVSCYDYKDINRITFATTMIFDETPVGDLEIYIDTMKPYRSSNESSDKGKRIIYKGTGKTVAEAIKDLNMQASSNINFTQCKAYIFTENVAKSGIRKYMDVINKNQELMIKSYMFVLFGNPEELLTQVEGDEEYLGVYIDELVRKVQDNPRVIATNANNYLDARTNYNNLLVLGALQVKNTGNKKTLELSGGAIFKDEVMVRKIGSSESMSFNFLTNNINSGTLEAINPQDVSGFVTLEITDSKTKTSLEYDGQRIKLFKNIKIKCYIAESQSRLMINEDVLSFIEQQEEGLIKQYCQLIFGFYKDSNLDIANVTRMFNQKFPNESLVASPLAITDIEVTVDVKIEGSSITGNTL